MKCPIITAGFFADPNASGMEAIDCLKKECGWWHTGLEECKFAILEDSITTIMGTLLHLSLDLEKSGKLPHWKPTT